MKEAQGRPASFFALATLSDGSLAQCRSGRFAEGARNGREAYDISLKAFGPKAGLTGGIAHTLADCLIELNRLDEAARLLEGIDLKKKGPASAQRVAGLKVANLEFIAR